MYQCGDIDFSGSKFFYFTLSWIYYLSVLHLLFYCRLKAPSNTTSFTLHSVLEKDKLTGTNFTSLIRNLRIVLRAEKREGVLGTPLPIDDNVKKSTGNSHVMAIQNKSIFKRKGNSWKKIGKAKDKIPMPNQAPKASPAAKAECFHCKKIGHGKETASCT
jgi:hypothetical protein